MQRSDEQSPKKWKVLVVRTDNKLQPQNASVLVQRYIKLKSNNSSNNPWNEIESHLKNLPIYFRIVISLKDGKERPEPS